MECDLRPFLTPSARLGKVVVGAGLQTRPTRADLKVGPYA